jgi:pilus assembly protein Flp/PilA
MLWLGQPMFAPDRTRQVPTERLSAMLTDVVAFFQSLTLRAGDEQGQTMAEYGILIAVIAIIVVVAAVVLGTNLTGLFSSASNTV